MKTQLKFLAAAALLTAGSSFAQSAGTWMLRAGATTIAPQVNSGFLSAPDYMNGTKTDVGADTELSGGITYMWSDHLAIDLPLALPFTHKIIGDGAIKGAGDVGEVKAVPFVVFLQYRFNEASAKFRPYVGLGATYAYFYDAKGSGKLTALTNPGGPATTLSVDSKYAATPQIGATFALGDKWFVDVHYSKTYLSTTTHLSTGQHLDITLDPIAYGVDIGYKF